MKKCLLTKTFLTKRRHQRKSLTVVYDVGQKIRLVYGNHKLNLTSEKKTIRLSSNIPSAFGTNNLHITTRWCIEMLEKYIQPGKILDVGTGAGLLAICAAFLLKDYTKDFSIEAFDIYQDAIKQAKTNLRLNSVETLITLKLNTILDYPQNYYSLIIANLPPIAIAELFDSLIGKLQKKGIIIISGILKHNISNIEQKLIGLGLEVTEKIETDLWCLIVGKKN
jgi:ribosomal protein L11 methyltransferase